MGRLRRVFTAALVLALGPFGRASGAGLTKEQAMKIVAPTFDAKNRRIGQYTVEELELRDWSYRQSTYVFYWLDKLTPANSEETDDAEHRIYRLHAAVLKAQGTVSVLATSDAIEIDVDPLEENICQSCTHALDVANYRLNDTETAFGVRVFLAGKSGESSSNTESLYLFRIRNKSLDMILTVNTREDEVTSREQGQGRETRRTLAMSDRLHHGFRDIVVRENGRRKPSQVFVWDPKGNCYR